MIHDTSASDATANVLILPITVTQAQSDGALLIAILSKSQLKTVLIVRLVSDATFTVSNKLLLIKSLTVIGLFLVSNLSTDEINHQYFFCYYL